VHRRQITFDALDTGTGEMFRGQIQSAPGAVGEWVGRFWGRVRRAGAAAIKKPKPDFMTVNLRITLKMSPSLRSRGWKADIRRDPQVDQRPAHRR
jgi:hypothetical protein